MDKHITAVAALFIAFGVLGVFLALIVLVAVVGGGLASGDRDAIWITGIVGPAVAVPFLLFGALEIVGGMVRLTRLDLHGTAVTDRGLARLEGLRELRSLNLYGTAVTDAGLAVIGGLAQLDAVYLWGTKVSENGVGELRQRLPRARVHHLLVLPEVSAAPQREGRGRRRRK